MSHVYEDTLSLTLPDWRTALKKVRRWKPPRPKSWLCAALCAIALLGVFTSMVAGQYFIAGWHTISAACWWRWAWNGPPTSMSRGSFGYPTRPADPVDYAIIGWMMLNTVLAFAFFVL